MMKNNDKKPFRERFKEFTDPSYYQRVDDSHPMDIYIGRNSNYNYAIEIRGKFKYKSLKSSTFIRNRYFQYEGDDRHVLEISLTDDSLFENFCILCEDLVDSSSLGSNDEDCFTCIVNCYYRWRKLFQNKTRLLDESHIMGLIGELSFLKDYLFENLDYSTAINSWSGWDMTHKDFSYDSLWYEIKAISKGKSSVKISSIEQLTSDHLGFLVVFKLERMSTSFDGISLNRLVTSILDMLSDDEQKEEFLSKLAEVNFSFSSDYDAFVYSIYEVNSYIVEEDFPLLNRNDIPSAIIKAQYELNLADIEEFKSDLQYGA